MGLRPFCACAVRGVREPLSLGLLTEVGIDDDVTIVSPQLFARYWPDLGELIDPDVAFLEPYAHLGVGFSWWDADVYRGVDDDDTEHKAKQAGFCRVAFCQLPPSAGRDRARWACCAWRARRRSCGRRSNAHGAGAASSAPRSGGVSWPRFASARMPERNPRIRSRKGEYTILNRIGMGRSNGQIATELGLPRGMVHTHRTRLMRKLGVHNTAGLVRFAVREGLIEA